MKEPELAAGLSADAKSGVFMPISKNRVESRMTAAVDKWSSPSLRHENRFCERE